MIIGITGTLGAGKGTVAGYLVKKHNFLYLSIRNFFAEEVLKRGQAVTRENITAVASALRAEHEQAYAVKELLKRAGRGGHGVVIESIRTTAEAEYLKSQGAKLWCVDAPLETRYKRFIGRAMPKDAVSFEEFTKKDKDDKDASDPTVQNLPRVCQMADATINSGGTKDETFAEVEKALVAAGGV
jgi:dephospho-CoA kinase